MAPGRKARAQAETALMAELAQESALCAAQPALAAFGQALDAQLAAWRAALGKFAYHPACLLRYCSAVVDQVHVRPEQLP